MKKLQPHLMVGEGDVAECVLIPGDPKRVELMAEHLTQAKKVGENRQFVTVTGWYKDMRVSIVSSGIGVPAMLITLEELYKLGCKKLIRVGTTGALKKNIQLGDLVIATAAVRTDGGTLAYAPAGYPAVADWRVVKALVEVCTAKRVKFHEGIVWTNDAYYAESAQDAKKWEEMNVLSVEMESSALFVFSSIKRTMAGSILVVDGNLALERKKSEVLKGQAAYDPLVLERIHVATDCALDALYVINVQERRYESH